MLLSKARSKLRVAEKLLELGEYEDAASRAYYAMLYAARAALALEGISPRTHEGVLREFGRAFVKTRKLPRELGAALSNAKSLRETANYSAEPLLEPDDAKWSVEAAKGFIEGVNKLLKLKGA